MSSATPPKTPPTQTAKLSVAGYDIELPVVVGTEDELGIDISSLRKETGCVTLDEGFVNTGSTTSGIYLSRWRKGDTALSGLCDRRNCRQLRLCGNHVLADLRQAPQRPRVERFPRVDSAAYDDSRRDAFVLQWVSQRSATPWPSSHRSWGP